MRKGSSTVVSIVGDVSPGLLDTVGRAPNVVALPARAEDEEAIVTLRRAQHVRSPFAVLAADPLGDVNRAWQRAWAEGAGFGDFEITAGRAVDQWRREGLELPDFYIVVAPRPEPVTPEPSRGPHRDDFHLGFLRGERPARVVTVVGSGDAGEDAVRVVHALSNLPQGPWWPALDELLDAARRYFPATLAEIRA